MTSVRCIFVETTVPVRIRPRMETSPVKGHFLSEGHETSVRGFTLDQMMFAGARLLNIDVPM